MALIDSQEAYEKPKCECGTELVVRMDKIADVR